MAQNRWSQERRGFLFPIVSCNQTGHHPQEDLAKYGYGPGIKVKKQTFIFCTPTGTCCRDMTIYLFSFEI
jgi:hypothetical protein